jgi:hypothetical protein
MPLALDIAAVALGVLTFIWGFMHWWDDSTTGFVYGSSSAAIGLSLVAAALVGAPLIAGYAKDSSVKATSSLTTALIAFGAFLLVIGALIGKPAGEETKVGLILALITTILQTAVLALAWLQSTGKVSLTATKGAGPAGYQQYGGYPQQGYQPPAQGYQAPQGGYGQPAAPQQPPASPPPAQSYGQPSAPQQPSTGGQPQQGGYPQQ